MYHELDFAIPKCKSRKELRRILVSQFVEEQPGKGKRELASKYRYNVETLTDGRRVYILRPAYLNKGFDFTVHVENTVFKKLGTDLPTHDDIFEDLRAKKSQSNQLWKTLYEGIESVYDLQEPDVIISGISDISFNKGFPLDLILKVIKWFFIEQDMTYWNWSGRAMFMSGVRALNEE